MGEVIIHTMKDDGVLNFEGRIKKNGSSLIVRGSKGNNPCWHVLHSVAQNITLLEVITMAGAINFKQVIPVGNRFIETRDRKTIIVDHKYRILLNL